MNDAQQNQILFGQISLGKTDITTAESSDNSDDEASQQDLQLNQFTS